MTVLCLAISVAGCGNKKMVQNSNVIEISIGNWPSDTEEANLEQHNKWVELMKEKYPNIKIVPDVGAYDVQTFLTKVNSGQLPTLFITYFTEASKIINDGYALDITDLMSKYGYKTAIKQDILNMVSSNGRIYGLPTYAYAMGLMINMNLFERAGLVREDGTPKIPQTFDELADAAATIKAKTGKAGFVMPTMNNCGGWHFMNFAWSYGTEFMKQENGRWTATFDSQECINALQFVKDLKWKYNALPENTFVDLAEMQRTFATDEAAMFFSSPPCDNLISNYGMSKDDIAIGCIPEGPKGKYALMGGGINMISPDATPEQADACFKWMDIIGLSVELTDEALKSQEEFYKLRADKGLIVGAEGLSIWENRVGEEKRTAIIEKYRNVNKNLFQEYTAFNNVTIKPEEPVACQQLYKVLDSCIQEVLNNKNADPAMLLKKANADFQKNYLD